MLICRVVYSRERAPSDSSGDAVVVGNKSISHPLQLKIGTFVRN